jgi:hypothetical protein
MMQDNIILNSYMHPSTANIKCPLEEILAIKGGHDSLFEYFAMKLYRNSDAKENHSIKKIEPGKGATVYDGTQWIDIPPNETDAVIEIVGTNIDKFGTAALMGLYV